MTRKRWATDHRALVLESVATSPRPATTATIVADCASADFSKHSVGSMIWWLRREGLLGRGDGDAHFVTAAGLEWLTSGRFDRKLPEPHVRLKARKQRSKK